MLINSRNQYSSSIHITPLSLRLISVRMACSGIIQTYNFVPMGFSDCALVQMLLSRSDVMRARQVSHDLCSSPTTIEYLRLGVRETPFQIYNGAAVCALTSEVVWVLQVDLFVRPT